MWVDNLGGKLRWTIWVENLGGKFEWKTWVEILGGTCGVDNVGGGVGANVGDGVFSLLSKSTSAST